MKARLMLLAVLTLTLSGCFIEPGQGTTIDFDGNMSAENGTFRMSGEVELGSGNPTQDSYEDIQLELYDTDGTLLAKRHLGTLRNLSQGLPVNISTRSVPKYVILDSPNIWSGQTGVSYFVKANDSTYYHVRGTNRRSDLPVTPFG